MKLFNKIIHVIFIFLSVTSLGYCKIYSQDSILSQIENSKDFIRSERKLLKELREDESFDDKDLKTVPIFLMELDQSICKADLNQDLLIRNLKAFYHSKGFIIPSKHLVIEFLVYDSTGNLLATYSYENIYKTSNDHIYQSLLNIILTKNFSYIFRINGSLINTYFGVLDNQVYILTNKFTGFKTYDSLSVDSLSSREKWGSIFFPVFEYE